MIKHGMAESWWCSTVFRFSSMCDLTASEPWQSKMDTHETSFSKKRHTHIFNYGLWPQTYESVWMCVFLIAFAFYSCTHNATPEHSNMPTKRFFTSILPARHMMAEITSHLWSSPYLYWFSENHSQCRCLPDQNNSKEARNMGVLILDKMVDYNSQLRDFWIIESTWGRHVHTIASRSVPKAILCKPVSDIPTGAEPSKQASSQCCSQVSELLTKLCTFDVVIHQADQPRPSKQKSELTSNI